MDQPDRNIEGYVLYWRSEEWNEEKYGSGSVGERMERNSKEVVTIVCWVLSHYKICNVSNKT